MCSCNFGFLVHSMNHHTACHACMLVVMLTPPIDILLPATAHYYYSLMLPHPPVSSFQTYYCCSSQNIFLESSPSQEERWVTIETTEALPKTV